MIDTYKYPGEDTLRNLFDCHDNDKLLKLESYSTYGNLLYLQQHPIKGTYDFAHLKAIHKFIFQNVYDWAGESRTVDIGKGNIFCRTQFIDSYAKSVFSDFYSSCISKKSNKLDFVKTLIDKYADINALHPFREGNGRTQREFIRELCFDCGYVLDLSSTVYHEILEASIDSFSLGDNSKLFKIFYRCVTPVSEYIDYDNKLRSSVFILSYLEMI